MEREALVLLAEMHADETRPWEAIRNSAFLEELEASGIAAHRVVVLPSGSLPLNSEGSIDGTNVVANFPRTRGYLRSELEAWVVNRLCQFLYLTPSEFDPSQSWARYGVDSAVALELLADLEDRVGIPLPPDFAESNDPIGLVKSVALHVFQDQDNLAWWRSPWTTVEVA